MCGVLGIPGDETPFTVDELMNADEVIMSSCSALCRKVVEVDGKEVGGKAPEILEKLQAALWDEFITATN